MTHAPRTARLPPQLGASCPAVPARPGGRCPSCGSPDVARPVRLPPTHGCAYPSRAGYRARQAPGRPGSAGPATASSRGPEANGVSTPAAGADRHEISRPAASRSVPVRWRCIRRRSREVGLRSRHKDRSRSHNHRGRSGLSTKRASRRCRRRAWNACAAPSGSVRAEGTPTDYGAPPGFAFDTGRWNGPNAGVAQECRASGTPAVSLRSGRRAVRAGWPAHRSGSSGRPSSGPRSPGCATSNARPSPPGGS